MRKFVARATRLYEWERQGREGSSALGMYVRRWCAWASGGLGPAGGSGSVPRFVYACFHALIGNLPQGRAAISGWRHGDGSGEMSIDAGESTLSPRAATFGT